MNRNIWKIALILAVLVIFTAAIIPTKNRPEPIRRGLDLKGGVQLVMQVNVNEAVRLEVDARVGALELLLEGGHDVVGHVLAVQPQSDDGVAGAAGTLGGLVARPPTAVVVVPAGGEGQGPHEPQGCQLDEPQWCSSISVAGRGAWPFKTQGSLRCK